MAEEKDRIEQIRARRSKSKINAAQIGRERIVQQRVRQAPQVGQVGGVRTAPAGAVGAGTPSPWMQDRVTLSLEAQIAMIEMRATYRLTLADMGYRNRRQIIMIRPGIYLKVEPTGCYRMVYHNRL